ncbi:MAG: hypothetical protein EAZ42_11415 [Verrucomicrobia bacterium]|nr:MAG: hypothetical protein EAZ42_11415 [Verrucomicrobiota bacterium]
MGCTFWFPHAAIFRMDRGAGKPSRYFFLKNYQPLCLPDHAVALVCRSVFHFSANGWSPGVGKKFLQIWDNRRTENEPLT